MHRFPDLYSFELCSQHLHGHYHHTDPKPYGVESADVCQDQDIGRARHEPGLDVSQDTQCTSTLYSHTRSSTGVSVGRFIVYYYRFAPTNTDRTWDIGVVISIAEPAVHIITACAPATKGLIRMLFPYFGTEYDERYPTYPPGSKSGSRAPVSKPRPSGAFNFGLSTKGLEEEQDVVVTERERASPRGEDVYGMRPLGSLDSREGIDHAHFEPSTHEYTASKPNTGYSKGDIDTIEAEPKHLLGSAR